MTLHESFRIARKNILANKTRSILSMLGMVIGISTVILVVSISNGMRLAVLESISSFGTNVLYLFPSFDTTTNRIGEIDLETIKRLSELPFVEGAFPQVSIGKEARAQAGQSDANAMGVYPRYFEVYRIPLAEGRVFDDREIQERALVCLLSGEMAQKLFGASAPLGKTVRFGNGRYEVIGIVSTSKRPSSLGRPSEDIYIPLPTLLRQEEKLVIANAEIWVKKDYTGDANEQVLEAASGDPSTKALFQIQDPKALQEEVRQTSRKFMLTGLALAGISLIVGGIGIMNVMLISVSERTREIGLRKAIGAAPRDILLQFLVEVSTLSGLGGGFGILLGATSAWALPKLTAGSMPTAIMPEAAAAAFVFSIVIGIVFGLFPAFKASRLSPVEALRSE
ncbi:MAG: ABC transporter permease [Elusimicrobia bacterium]|nr:ABC transporter permease [Elusimicrobiota bacterium]